MRLLVYGMLVNVNGIYYVHVCEQVRWARSVGNSAIENLCIIIFIKCIPTQTILSMFPFIHLRRSPPFPEHKSSTLTGPFGFSCRSCFSVSPAEETTNQCLALQPEDKLTTDWKKFCCCNNNNSHIYIYIYIKHPFSRELIMLYNFVIISMTKYTSTTDTMTYWVR